MRFRFVLLLVAFVLAWSGLGTADPSRADVASGGVAVLERAADAAPEGVAGPSEPLLPDDRSVQAHGDPSPESPAIVPDPLASRPAGLAQRHAGVHRAAAAAPYLDGPLRPPRSGARAA